ncbi:hypothetical protein HDIA_1485 [Hartmannibacter diazotrophicus]|uniref:Uncharacterized protein n=1 Tax=Hartmannibacter diazotrophicus TaxID=1482074 RepID=A0A2C9D420_9HYPH|nr:hypothetical protein [Hartmannibacter diazotrophicus]SON55026.1 hypothetical protein HDIA_1485 [Hartmannibacter diazotrophicus]
MAKGQNRGNREVRKPKAVKPVVSAAEKNATGQSFVATINAQKKKK